MRPVSQPTDTIHDIANFLYESRPRLTAEEVREILHKSGAPPSWAKPSACVGAGTIVLRQSAALCEAQEEFYQLRRALSKWVVDLRCDRKLSEEATSFLAGQGADETGANWTRAVEYEALLRELDTAPKFADLRVRDSVYTWHYSAVLLYDKYNEIVGSSSASAKGPAVRFVKKMLVQLKIHYMATEGAIEQMLRRGVKELRARGVELGLQERGNFCRHQIGNSAYI